MFLGTDDVAASCLRVLAQEAPVALAVAPPRRRRGRRGEDTPAPAAAAAQALGVPVLETADVNAPDALARIAQAAPRLLVVVAFGQILKRAVREAAPLGAVNLHFSILPRWRGAAPVHRAILAGDAETGVCVQRLWAKLDAGPVLLEAREPIPPRATTASLLARLTERGAPLLGEAVRRLLAGETPPERVQDEAQVTYAAKVAPEEGDLDFAAEDAAALDRRVRAFGDAPGCRVVLARAGAQPLVLLVREAEPAEGAGGPPGAVLAASTTIDVAARAGVLRIARLQREGGKALAARDFLNGVALRAGDRLERLARG